MFDFTDRLGQGAVQGPEPTDEDLRREKLEAEYGEMLEEERERRRERMERRILRRAECRLYLYKLERLAGDALGDEEGRRLTEPLWDLIEEAA